MSAYKGAPGETITITAVDDVKVKTVGILIGNDDGTLVEKGTAIPTAGSVAAGGGAQRTIADRSGARA